MKYKLNFGTSAAAMPCDVTGFLSRAGLCDMRVFVYLCSVGGNAEINEIAASVGSSIDEVNSSLAFWRGTGLILEDSQSADASVRQKASVEKTAPAKKEESVETKKVASPDKMPSYTSDELAHILESQKEMAMLIDECNHILGKMLNFHEVNIIVGLIDYLALDIEYVLLLVKHCAENGKKTLHYIEKTAFALYDDGITTAETLTEELSRREAATSAEGRIRSIFGIGSRALTTREKREVSSWVNDMKYPIEVIEKAYEITVDATSKPTLHYANTVLERWHSEGLLTLDQILDSYKEKGNAKGKKSGASAPDVSSSFDTDEFFDAAVKRNLGE